MPTSSRIGIGQCVEACGQERAWVDDVCQISGVLGLECGFSCRKVHVGGKPRQVPLMDDGEREEGPRRTGGTSSPCGGHSYLHLETWEITLQLEGKARVGPEGQEEKTRGVPSLASSLEVPGYCSCPKEEVIDRCVQNTSTPTCRESSVQGPWAHWARGDNAGKTLTPEPQSWVFCMPMIHS
ncbi:hypothetical protein Cadr_000021401 [Camelus dromedarius]|uniref:Uncharacterized protein n=1 Tax=Camelus dromedarius TaxID=9838 RepID=A0A5N4CUL7_CAMDR|nr:hypothetical protein Cadr_000021401 [Camelus dromedarius]